MTFFYLCSDLRHEANHLQLVRDSKPTLQLDLTASSLQRASAHEQLIHETCQQFFSKYESAVFSVCFSQSECVLQHLFKNHVIRVQVDLRLTKDNKDKNQQLLLYRLRKVFEHSAVVPKKHQQRFLERLWTQAKPIFQTPDSSHRHCHLLFWTTGSGKTIGSLLLFSFIAVDTVIVLCLNTTIDQWG